MSTQPIVKLNDGNLMPQFGLGVWQASVADTTSAVSYALEIGYRAIDTAAIYKNEEGVGSALQSAGLPREDLFITTKLWNDDQHQAEHALTESLKKLQLDYVDLYLIHWPKPQQDQYIDAWRDLKKLQDQGLIKSIGVCNFPIAHLQRLHAETGIVPVVNQIELHPMFQQQQLRTWDATHNILTQSWSPLAQGGKGVFEQPIIQALAQKYGKTPAQVVIRWHLDSGLIVIPKSVTPARIKENFEVFDFRLQRDELAAIATLDIGKRLGPDPEEF